MDLNKVGKYIAKKRNEAGLTQQQLADLLGINDKTISKWERGINAPDISLLQNLAKELRTTVVNILNGNDRQKRDDESNILMTVIPFYVSKYKNKFLKILLVVVLIVIFLILVIYGYERYNHFFVYNIYTENADFDVSGYLIYNSNSKIIVINNINYNDIYVGTDKEIITNEIEISLLCNNDILLSTGYFAQKENANENYFNELLNNVKLDINQSNNSKIKLIDKSDMNKLSLQVEYIDDNGEEQIKNIKLKVK